MNNSPIPTWRKVVVGLVVLLIAIGVGHWYVTRISGEPEEMSCTAEAFQCPDGSYVGRGGPNCAFAPCPNQEFFTGTLGQDANGFRLLIGAPGGGEIEVSYAMPLELNVTNAVGQLVGKKVRVYGSFLEGGKLSVDRVEELSGDAGDPTLGEVGVGGSIFVNGVRITLNRVVQDSRCPVGVQCIWAGNVTVNVSLRSDTDDQIRDIASDAAPVGFDSYRISIAGVKPIPVAGAAQNLENYLVTFRVSAN